MLMNQNKEIESSFSRQIDEYILVEFTYCYCTIIEKNVNHLCIDRRWSVKVCHILYFVNSIRNLCVFEIICFQNFPRVYIFSSSKYFLTFFV